MRFEYRARFFDIQGVSQNDHIYRRIARSGTFYEIDLLEYIYRLKPFIYKKKIKNVALDVGANIGNHSIFIASFLVDHLIAIEPNPAVIYQLHRNLSKNLKNYTLCQLALAEKEGKGAIILPENMSNNIGAAKIDLQNDKGNINISTLDLVFSLWSANENDPITLSLIKIDVEGMEIEVLKGAEKTIQKYRPHIFVEAATKIELQRIYNYLRYWGYRKMPGHCATTPVYHFVHEPRSLLFVAVLYAHLRKLTRKFKNRLLRRFN